MGFLCEAMEREAADEDFGELFCADSAIIYGLVETIDHGKPLGGDLSMGALWCALKLYMDCLPAPLLSFTALDDLRKHNIRRDDYEAKRKFLVDIFQNKLASEQAYVALYTASFLRTMCMNAQDRVASLAKENRQSEAQPNDSMLTPASAAKVFASGFFRPKKLSHEDAQTIPVAIAVVETLTQCAEESDLWVGRHTAAPRWERVGASSSESSEEEDQGSLGSFYGTKVRAQTAP